MFALFGIILLISHVENKIIFAAMVFLATIIPDMDTGFSRSGKNFAGKSLQLFVKHRGIVHSLTAGIFLSILLAVYWPVSSMGFFLGWAIHMICDSFTKDGIQPLWPLKFKSSGFILTGGKFEETLFLSMIGINLVFFLILFLW
jgi:membrane-bound metal-dependent hydrolase YbcI (DUF457 family)